MEWVRGMGKGNGLRPVHCKGHPLRRLRRRRGRWVPRLFSFAAGLFWVSVPTLTFLIFLILSVSCRSRRAVPEQPS